VIEELEPKVLSRKDHLGKYCFKHEHKLKSKNSGKVLNSYKEITIREKKKKKTRHLWGKNYLFKKTYNASISAMGRNTVILLPTLYTEQIFAYQF